VSSLSSIVAIRLFQRSIIPFDMGDPLLIAFSESVKRGQEFCLQVVNALDEVVVLMGRFRAQLLQIGLRRWFVSVRQAPV
jgi:hypothetical protein